MSYIQLCQCSSKSSSKYSQYCLRNPKPPFFTFFGFPAARCCVWYCPCHSLGPYLPRKRRIFQIGWELFFFIWIHIHRNIQSPTNTNIVIDKAVLIFLNFGFCVFPLFGYSESNTYSSIRFYSNTLFYSSILFDLNTLILKVFLFDSNNKFEYSVTSLLIIEGRVAVLSG